MAAGQSGWWPWLFKLAVALESSVIVYIRACLSSCESPPIDLSRRWWDPSREDLTDCPSRTRMSDPLAPATGLPAPWPLSSPFWPNAFIWDGSFVVSLYLPMDPLEPDGVKFDLVTGPPFSCVLSRLSYISKDPSRSDVCFRGRLGMGRSSGFSPSLHLPSRSAAACWLSFAILSVQYYSWVVSFRGASAVLSFPYGPRARKMLPTSKCFTFLPVRCPWGPSNWLPGLGDFPWPWSGSPRRLPRPLEYPWPRTFISAALRARTPHSGLSWPFPAPSGIIFR